MNEQMQYGKLIRDTMAARGMTQRDVSDITGWSQSVVSDILNGKRTVTPPEVVRTLAKVLELPRAAQLQSLGYLDPAEPEPGIAYAVPEGSARADLLALLDGMTDDEVRAVADVVMASTRFFGLARSGGLRDRDHMTQSINDRSTNRTA